jgi:hypothetical protein
MSVARGGPIAWPMARTAKANSGAVGARAPARRPSLGRVQSMLRITRYQKSRYWALWDGNELVAVVVYKKGLCRETACGNVAIP